MIDQRSLSHKLSMGARGLGILVAISLGVAACGSGARGTSSVAASVAHIAAVALPSATPEPPAVATLPAVVSASAPTPAIATSASAKAPSTTGHSASAVGPTKPATTATTPNPTTTASTLPPRTQPTPAQVSQAIAAVHHLVPFFTPTAAQVAKVGNEVCTAFDQGMTLSQVKSKVKSMLGSLSWLISSSTVGQGVRTIVSLYCPGYAARAA